MTQMNSNSDLENDLLQWFYDLTLLITILRYLLRSYVTYYDLTLLISMIITYDNDLMILR